MHRHPGWHRASGRRGVQRSSNPIVPDSSWEDRLDASRRDWEEGKRRTEERGSSKVIPSPDFDVPWQATGCPLEEEDPDLHRSLQAQTRDAPPSVELVCLYDSASGPCFNPEGTDPIDLKAKPTTDVIRKVLNRAVSMGDPTIVRFFRERNTPRSWERSALLGRYKVAVFSKVFPLTEHCCTCGGRTLVLSEELGLRIKESEPDDPI